MSELFGRAEYDARLRRTRERMSAQGLDALVVVEPANLYYLTGYDAWSFYTPQALVVPLEGELLLFTRAIDAPGALMTTSLAAEQVIGFPDDYVQQPGRHPFDVLAAELSERVRPGARIGLESDAYYFSSRADQALRFGLSGVTFVDSGELVNWVRVVKSAAELEAMRRAARIVERVMATAIDAVDAGIRQCDAAAEIMRAQARGTEEWGGDYPAIVPMMPSGPGTRTAHLTWSDAPFRQGEATVIELAAAHRHYHCPMARTVFLGTPPAKLRRTSEAVMEGLEAALDTVKPGVRCEEVEAAWRRTIARHGLEKPSRIGYSVGIGYPPDWGEHTLSLRPGDRTELAPGMTFHLMLGMWLDEIGLELSEVVQVTDSGAECLARFPRELAVKR
ncbi:MAG TPA: M24 family metallopeptidase [Solirubrobacteraceae bacterium]|nr:M24 family metallopeptidase [Solirubrobacteraceae bacterium]